jgi:hypothetical protein
MMMNLLGCYGVSTGIYVVSDVSEDRIAFIFRAWITDKQFNKTKTHIYIYIHMLSNVQKKYSENKKDMQYLSKIKERFFCSDETLVAHSWTTALPDQILQPFDYAIYFLNDYVWQRTDSNDSSSISCYSQTLSEPEVSQVLWKSRLTKI